MNHLARPGPSSRLFGATVVFIPSGNVDVDERRRRRRATSMKVVKSDSDFIDERRRCSRLCVEMVTEECPEIKMPDSNRRGDAVGAYSFTNNVSI